MRRRRGKSGRLARGWLAQNDHLARQLWLVSAANPTVPQQTPRAQRQGSPQRPNESHLTTPRVTKTRQKRNKAAQRKENAYFCRAKPGYHVRRPSPCAHREVHRPNLPFHYVPAEWPTSATKKAGQRNKKRPLLPLQNRFPHILVIPVCAPLSTRRSRHQPTPILPRIFSGGPHRSPASWSQQ